MLQGETESAIHSLEALHTSAPADAPVARLLASAYVTSGAPEKANALYAALLTANPGDATLQVEWADCLIRQKRSPEAEPVLQRALAQGSAFPNPQARANAYGMLAFAASANHDPETVLKAIAARNLLRHLQLPILSFRPRLMIHCITRSKQSISTACLCSSQAVSSPIRSGRRNSGSTFLTAASSLVLTPELREVCHADVRSSVPQSSRPRPRNRVCRCGCPVSVGIAFSPCGGFCRDDRLRR